ncbi:hypothetical protein [Actinocrispum wychmicini]|uniref:Uncharacterized protein n=1 Tax=Actinocrispum wychmicini TaxID=1213861 RepID=A0A4R2J269_9PSEU|nr:hypothetical protein [Actinocrispum wychmicini]TCO50928.1 hypothetical protein EV192_113311 [Actinocrispum wychmicini]
MTVNDLVTSALRERAALAPDPDMVSATAIAKGRKRRTQRRAAGMAGVAAVATAAVIGSVALTTSTESTPSDEIPVANTPAEPDQILVVARADCRPGGKTLGKTAVVVTPKTAEGFTCVVVQRRNGKVPDSLSDTVSGGRGARLGPADKDGFRISSDGRSMARQLDPDHWLGAVTARSYPVPPADVMRLAVGQVTFN